MSFIPSLHPKLVTLLGIKIDVRPLQLEKAAPSMVFMLLGIVIEFKRQQPENILNIDNQLLTC